MLIVIASGKKSYLVSRARNGDEVYFKTDWELTVSWLSRARTGKYGPEDILEQMRSKGWEFMHIGTVNVSYGE